MSDGMTHLSAQASLPDSDPRPRNRRGNPNWKKGGPSPNPGGKIRFRGITEALRKWTEEGGADYCRKRIVKLIASAKDQVSIQAIQFVAERVEGKPTQAHTVTYCLDEASFKRLSEVGDRFLELSQKQGILSAASAPESPTIDAEVLEG